MHFEVQQVLCLLRNLHFEVHQVLCLPRNLHFEVHQVPNAVPATKSALRGHHKCCDPARRGSQSAVPVTKSAHRGPQSAAPVTKSANEPHVQKSRFTARGTKSELFDDDHQVQSAAPATKIAFRSKTAPIPCACHEKSALEHQNTRFALHGTTTRAQSLEAPAAGPQILRACAVEMHIDDFEMHECTVNSSELAGHARGTAI